MKGCQHFHYSTLPLFQTLYKWDVKKPFWQNHLGASMENSHHLNLILAKIYLAEERKQGFKIDFITPTPKF